jgi:hypothetical protein
METNNLLEQRILEKIRQLPLEKVVEVEDFVDFLSQGDMERRLSLAATRLAEPAFQKVWGNLDDAVYDNL